MARTILARLGILLASLLLLVPGAQAAGRQDFTLHNETGVEIHSLHVSPHNVDDWQEDVLGRDTLADGDSLQVEFSPKERVASWDLKVTDHEGAAIVWEKLNLLEISDITLHFDAKTGQATAEFNEPPARPEAKQDFTLHNKTGVEIHSLHVSPHNVDDWQEDVLGRDTLSDDESIEISFSPKERAAFWDLKVTDDEGTAIVWEKLNLLEISEITLHFDAKSGQATADLRLPARFPARRRRRTDRGTKFALVPRGFRRMVPLSGMRPEDTLTLDDLAHWSEPGTHLAVLGHPVKHSLSPAMHNAALRALAAQDNRFASWRYWKFDVHPDRLDEALDLLRARGFAGLNLTVPHKILALDLVAAVDPTARDIGAVNTLRLTPDGYEGFNTDGYGLATAIAREFDLPLAGADVILLGAGGAARGGAVECLRQGCRSLWIGNRSRGTLDALLHQIHPLPGGDAVRDFILAEPPPDLPAGAIVINATSAGLSPDEPPPVDLTDWPRPTAVFDMVYNPARPPLLVAAERLGLRNANGLAMLVHQGARALSLWTGTDAPADVMHLAALAALNLRP